MRTKQQHRTGVSPPRSFHSKNEVGLKRHNFINKGYVATGDNVVWLRFVVRVRELWANKFTNANASNAYGFHTR